MFLSKLPKLVAFAGGVLFGTAGIKALASKDAKKIYVHTTAAALRAKDSVMETVTKVQENAEDILDEAKELNEQREADEVVESPKSTKSSKAKTK